MKLKEGGGILIGPYIGKDKSCIPFWYLPFYRNARKGYYTLITQDTVLSWYAG